METEQTLPTCLGFIMDGNRRWAKTQGLDTLEGHKQGHEVFKECIRWLRDTDISHGVFYAFSIENWGRTEREVAYLMKLFDMVISETLSRVDEGQVRYKIIGHRSDFTLELQEKMQLLEQKSAVYDGTTVWMALSYGGRAEIVAGVNKAVQAGAEVTEDSFKELLWSAEMPDPDMIVRTSGERRLSGFLTWASVYSELHFIDKHWPALTKSNFDAILTEYGTRQRRRGK